MVIRPALLERWMRDYYFETEIDIGSSGVRSFGQRELRAILEVSNDELDAVVYDDSKTLGGEALRRAIADRWAGGRVDRVMATHGSSEAIFLVMHALLRPGDEVIVLHPCYQQLFAIAESIGVELKFWRMRYERNFVPDVEELCTLLTSRTRMVIVNLPHNPTGAMLSASDMERLVSLTAERGAYLVWDSAFRDIWYGESAPPDPAEKYDRVITLGTLSKSFGLPGLRVGWCIAPPSVLAECAHLRDYLTLHLSPLVELMAERAISYADRLLDIRRREALTNRALVQQWMEEHADQLSWVAPQGGVCTFPRLCDVDDATDLCRRLAEESKVLLVPGVCFDLPAHVRLGFGGPTEDLRKGLRRFGRALERVV